MGNDYKRRQKFLSTIVSMRVVFYMTHLQVFQLNAIFQNVIQQTRKFITAKISVIKYIISGKLMS